ncbi:CDP-alcohol phosphatidyltransferase [Mycobacterium sp. GA-1841]|uniref:CDP-alcohol phosphatidyltransferase family protein n=1 Tax=Mycobacterium sp. GA-1841 TaxID=1834154 RepID=UPI00096D4E3C|nr:CDP-alcohol phosphatidyltransferase family protein [Mycobacterium sp. GA-1841]OMC31831.1 CDP-alcohol phosphatidyltransferase [Mycobacterium sp. GA-1841]
MQGLYALKPWYTRRLGGIVDAAVARGISPDVFTVAGVIAAAAAAVAVAYGWWPLVFVLLGARLAGANLDGAVARAREVSRPWGFVLNEIGDRTSDLLVFAGLTVWAARTGGSVIWVLVAALAATLPTFASLAAAGAGATRRNGGPFGKTERCLAIVVACALPALLGWVCAVIVTGSALTMVTRLLGTHRELAV